MLFFCSRLANLCFSSDLENIDSVETPPLYESKDENESKGRHTSPLISLLPRNSTQVLSGKNNSSSRHAENYVPFTRRRDSTGTIEPELLGNDKVIFATPFLEKYTYLSAIVWTVLNPIFDEFEWWASIGATCLTNYATFQSNRKSENLYIVCAIQLVILAQTLDKFANFSKKVIPIREKQYAAYAEANRQNRNRNSNLNIHSSVDLIGNSHVVHSSTFSDERISSMEKGLNESCLDTPATHRPIALKSKFLESYYSYLACFRNIAWDQMGSYTIACQAISSSLLIWSLIATETNHKDLMVLSSFLAIAGSASQGYAKYSSKKTQKIERKAIELRDANRAANAI